MISSWAFIPQLMASRAAVRTVILNDLDFMILGFSDYGKIRLTNVIVFTLKSKRSGIFYDA
jgi:hypothetical protein